MSDKDSMSILEEYNKSLKLPIGHYDRKKAKEKLDREYEECFSQERELVKRLKNPSIPKDKILALCDFVCDTLSVRRIKSVVLRSNRITPGAAGEYHPSDRTIHFPYNFARTITLIHELSHHIVGMERGFSYGGMHGKGFLEAELLVFETALNFLA